MNIEIKWMTGRDYDQVLEIENQSFASPWTYDEMRRFLLDTKCVAIVAVDRRKVVGYAFVEWKTKHLRIANIAVHQDCVRNGIGRLLIAKLKRILRNTAKTRIRAEVMESNLKALQFFKALDFVAIEMVRDFYNEIEDDMIVMQFDTKDHPNGFSVQNRISKPEVANV